MSITITAKTRSRGITLIEILIALGVLVVFLSFATPALQGASAKTELRAATENLEFSVHSARTMARQLETDVVMQLHNDESLQRHSVSFSFPSGHAGLNSSSVLQDFQFSPGIRLVSDTPSVHFDSRGIPELPAQILLVSSQDDEINHTILIQ